METWLLGSSYMIRKSLSSITNRPGHMLPAPLTVVAALQVWPASLLMMSLAVEPPLPLVFPKMNPNPVLASWTFALILAEK